MSTLRSLLSSLSVLFLLFAASPTYAQESVKLEPAIIEEKVDAGSVLSPKIRITNDSAETRTYYLLVRDIKDMVNNEPVFAEPGEAIETGVSSWIKLPVSSLTLKAGEQKEIQLTVSIPKDAYPGSHFGGVFASLQPTKLHQTGAGVGFQVGSILIYRLGGDADTTARIREFKVDRNIYRLPEVNFSLKIENQGNVLIRPRGPVEIQNMFGKTVATLVMNNDNLSVYPKKEREFTANWTSSNLAFGRYQAVASMGYGEDAHKTITAVVSFWILPYHIILPVVIGIILLFVLVFGLMRWYVYHRLAQLNGGAPVARRSGHTDLSFSRLMLLTFGMLVLVLLLLAALILFFGG